MVKGLQHITTQKTEGSTRGRNMVEPSLKILTIDVSFLSNFPERKSEVGLVKLVERFYHPSRVG